MKKILLLVPTVLLTIQIGYAQFYEPDERVAKSADRFAYFDKFFYISLDVNQPLSNTDWIDRTSARGFKAGFRKMINTRFSAGVDVNFSTYDQYQPTITVESPGGAITTDFFKYVYTYGVTVTGQYYLLPADERIFLPYVGLGLGVANHEFVSYYNIYSDSETKWGFLARPEIGAFFPFSRKVGAMAAVHFDYASSKSDFFEYDNFMNAGFQVGILFMSF